ncbi:NAD(P)H-hydrate dehydratase [Rhodococcus sp. X156]|uniref:NAD(P)H-hydrate dehydratase n=1 Tax=Rhodococcus sp. X156 TaxID=2499145 RepID=UPI001F49B13E|nr:NAD(P)H-hydrate dehydratase [Rhodococcus sp. X156]
MLEAHDVAAVRAAEGAVLARTPENALMRRAAFGLATTVLAELRTRCGGASGRQVVLLVGAGGNGGDALWAGHFLQRRGVGVRAVLLSPDKTHAAALRAFLLAGGQVVTAPEDPEVPVPELVDTAGVAEADLVVDGIVGLGASGGLRPTAAALVAAVRAPIVAVDLPSGVHPDTGVVQGSAVRAAVTVTFGSRKPVHLLAASHCGRVELVPLGLELPPATLGSLERAEVGRLWPVPGREDDKYSQGVVGVAAGSAQYPGAAVLATSGAVAATSGMVRYAGTGADAVLAHRPEVVAVSSVADAGRVQAWVVGPGLGTGAESVAVLEHVLAAGVPVLVDADGTTVLAEHPELLARRTAPVLLTPHAGEFARLVGGDVGPDRLGAVRAAARRLDATVLLKGSTTIIATPAGDALVNVAAGGWAATAGSGDVLSGVLGALLASGLDPLTAAGAGAHVHALAAELAAAGAPTSATPLADHLSEAIRQCRAAQHHDTTSTDAGRSR